MEQEIEKNIYEFEFIDAIIANFDPADIKPQGYFLGFLS